MGWIKQLTMGRFTDYLWLLSFLVGFGVCGLGLPANNTNLVLEGLGSGSCLVEPLLQSDVAHHATGEEGFDKHGCIYMLCITPMIPIIWWILWKMKSNSYPEDLVLAMPRLRRGIARRADWLQLRSKRYRLTGKCLRLVQPRRYRNLARKTCDAPAPADPIHKFNKHLRTYPPKPRPEEAPEIDPGEPLCPSDEECDTHTTEQTCKTAQRKSPNNASARMARHMARWMMIGFIAWVALDFAGHVLGFSGQGPCVVTPSEFSDLETTFEAKVHAVRDDAVLTSRHKMSTLNRLSSTSPSLFVSMLSWSCCFGGGLSAQMLYSECLRFNMLTQEQRKNELLTHTNLIWNNETDLEHCSSAVGRRVECYCGLYGVAESEWLRTLQNVKSGCVHWEHANTGRAPTMSDNGHNTRVWMRSYFDTLGDFQPDNGQIHLPPMDKHDIFLEMSAELDGKHLDESSFRRIWRKEFVEVRIPSQSVWGSVICV